MIHLKTFKAGEFGYIQPRMHGTFDVWHDQKRYIYKTTKPKIARNFILNAWDLNNVRLSGKYPNYQLEVL